MSTGLHKKYTLDNILAAIKGSGGVMSLIAKRLKCRWSTAYRYCMLWQTTKEALADEEEIVLDLAESILYDAIKNKDVQASKWLLSTKGKKRGYSERHELTGAEGGKIEIIYSKNFDGV